MSNQQIIIIVRNNVSGHKHFERILEWNNNIVFPFDSVCSSLLLLFKDINVSVEFNVQQIKKPPE